MVLKERKLWKMKVLIDVELENVFEIKEFKSWLKSIFRGSMAQKFKLKKVDVKFL